MTAPGYRLDEAVEAVLTELSDRSLLDGVGDDLHREIGEAIVKAEKALADIVDTWTRAHTAPEDATAIRARKGGGDE